MAKRRRPSVPQETPEQALTILADFEMRMDAALEPVRQDFQTVLNGLAGRSFGSYEANRLVTSRAQLVLNRLATKVQCQRQGCGKPARLRCMPASAPRPWTFQFEHDDDGKPKRHGGWRVLPPLELGPVVPGDNRPVGPVAASRDRRPSRPDESMETAERVILALARVEALIEATLAPVKADLQDTLRSLAGRFFNSYESNCLVVRRVNRIRRRLNVGLKCQCPGCGEPAKLVSIRLMGGWPWGIQFHHLAGGSKKRHGSWVEFPPLELVALADVGSASESEPDGE